MLIICWFQFQQKQDEGSEHKCSKINETNVIKFRQKNYFKVNYSNLGQGLNMHVCLGVLHAVCVLEFA